jgi:hypothetical protein
MRQFGNPGYGPGYADNGTKDTVMQVFEVDKGWKEMTITWDNAPVPRENTGRTLVRPLPGDCKPTPYWFCSPGIPYMFDVTQIVKRAQAGGRGWASLALYTAAGQYHSGKFFWSREGAEPPIVRIGYLPVEDARPVGATAPAQDGTSGRQSPTAQPVPVKPPATVKPQLAPAVLPTVTPTVTPTATPIATSALKPKAGRTYYISPGGSDSNNGSTAETAWGTFERAWESLQAGDTLLLLDGVYTGVMWPNLRNGEPGRPITIKALNDGQAVIDGEGARIPVRIGEVWGPNGPVGNYYVVEGLVIRNGTYATMRVEGSHNVVRRVSLYNASTDENSTVLWVSAGGNNLIEDCVAAGTGRYMIELYEGQGGNTVRRCLAMWQEWNGRRFCGIHWPNGQGIGVYNTSNNTVENSISYGRATLGFLLQANSDTAVAANNHILGSLSLLSGADYDGSPWYYGSPTLQPTTRPQTQTAEGTSCDGNYAQWNWGNQRTGFEYWGQGTLQDNVFRDIVAAGNIGVGWGSGYPGGEGPLNTVIDHATLYDNGSDITSWENDLGGNIHLDRGGAGVTITNSRIANSDWAEQGEGARLLYRYVDRQLTDQPLWPWPMEKRIQAELGVSVTKLVAKYRGKALGQ